ncbi:MAG: 23S rRNA (guanosine(2251)-2'-O)-methyltransferase RlmB [Bacteroidota bacterium]|nr:23S rRNA (guanosine(2251)-2'-O)-methyltransferase RlmB [Bacteroidota bacterium]
MREKSKITHNLIVGRNPVIEALRAATPIVKIFLLHGIRGGNIETIYSLAKERKIPCIEINRNKFEELTSDDVNQGVAAIIEEKKFVDVDDILEIALTKEELPLILILDEIQDPQNLGAIIRTAECAGVHGVIIPKHNAAPVTSTVTKASAGAVEYVAMARVTNIAQTIDELKENGVWIVGTDSSADKKYTELDYKIPLALVVGSEGRGMRRLVKEKCDFLVKIPLFGKIESLNASVAAALLVYEVVRKRK